MTVNVTSSAQRHDDLRGQIFARAEVAMLEQTKHDPKTVAGVNATWGGQAQPLGWGPLDSSAGGKSASVVVAGRQGWIDPHKVDGAVVHGAHGR